MSERHQRVIILKIERLDDCMCETDIDGKPCRAAIIAPEHAKLSAYDQLG